MLFGAYAAAAMLHNRLLLGHTAAPSWRKPADSSHLPTYCTCRLIAPAVLPLPSRAPRALTQRRAYSATRELHDGAAAPPLPPALSALAARAAAAASSVLAAAGRTKFPAFRPDVCLCNYYPERSVRVARNPTSKLTIRF